MEQGRVPSSREIREVIRLFRSPPHLEKSSSSYASQLDLIHRVDAHVYSAKRVATHISRQLRQRGFDVNLPLVKAFLELHDCAKHVGAASEGMIADELERRNYPELAHMVRHSYGRSGARNFSLNHKLALYCDWRSSLLAVPLDYRLAGLIERRTKGTEPHEEARIRAALELSKSHHEQFERELQSKGIDTRIGNSMLNWAVASAKRRKPIPHYREFRRKQ